MRLLKIGLGVLLWIVVAFCLAATVAPFFLDRVYYHGPVSSHFDGSRFFNPDGDDDRLATTGPTSRTRLIAAQIFGDSTRPWWPEQVAVTHAKPAARIEGGRMVVTWVGHATTLIQADGLNILTDPVWSERAGPFGIGPRRVAAPGIAFADLPKIDLVLISHNHYDHMDVATLKRLWDRDRPTFVTSLGNDGLLRRAGIPARGEMDDCFVAPGVEALDWGRQTQIGWEGPRFEGAPPDACTSGSVTVTVTRSHHWDSRWFADRNRALWSSFVVALPHGNIFFAGDTGLGDGKWPAEAAALGPIRFAAIPIGAFRFAEGQMGIGSHIGPRDAIRVWNGLGRPAALPIHWGTFRLSREGYATPPRMLHAMLRCAGSDPARFQAVPVGTAIEIPPLGTSRSPDFAALDRCIAAGAFDSLR
ncbi:MBL fold metallo-hydrolase [Sphingomonas sp. MMS12-HWE2-04]|uniref:MBL fold metallo-hydrolase n=1 Tax=Sphingomonas sp. MMS12-HWE2-04 TaxID=3234199 RepID=UPI00384F5640